MTRILSVRAATVAIRSSGQMIIVIIEAGTTIPPIPRPASTRIPQSWYMLSTRPTAIAPHPAVMRTEETIISTLLAPLKMDRRKRTITAPTMMLKPTGIPRMPTSTGLWPYTFV